MCLDQQPCSCLISPWEAQELQKHGEEGGEDPVDASLWFHPLIPLSHSTLRAPGLALVPGTSFRSFSLRRKWCFTKIPLLNKPVCTVSKITMLGERTPCTPSLAGTTLPFYMDRLCFPCFALLLCLFEVFFLRTKGHPRALMGPWCWWFSLDPALVQTVKAIKTKCFKVEFNRCGSSSSTILPILLVPSKDTQDKGFNLNLSLVLGRNPTQPVTHPQVSLWAHFAGIIQNPPVIWSSLNSMPKLSPGLWWEFIPKLLRVFSFQPFQPQNVSWDCRVINGKTKRHPVCKIYDLILILAIPWIETSLLCRNPPKMPCSPLLLTQHFIDPCVCATWMMDYLISNLAVFI